MLFSERKAAQIAAFFIFKEGGELGILKLIKLMYLAERESFTRYGEPITGDTFYSLDHGPILSSTLDHINNLTESAPGGWESWIKDRENHLVSLQQNGDPTPNLTELSDADLEILAHVWDQYGHMTGSQLRNLTHQICEEWEDPNGSRLPIPYGRILKCVGHKDHEVIKELLQRIESQRIVDTFLNNKVI
jgi:uncharacterized phage-associated protein